MASTYAASILALGPTLYLRCGEESGAYVDASGYGRDFGGSLSGASYGEPGAIVGDTDTSHGAFMNARSDDALSLNDLGLLGDHTIILWFKTTSVYTSFEYMLGMLEGGGTYIMSAASNGFIRYSLAGANFTAFGWNFSLFDGEWHMLAFTHDVSAKTLTALLDGVEFSDYTYSGTLADETGVVRFCNTNVASFGRPWRGSMDEFCIIPSRLSDEQIAALYAEALAENASGGGTLVGGGLTRASATRQKLVR